MDNSTKLDAINTVLTSIANTTTNDYGKVALNVYQIYPKKIYYPITARTNYAGLGYVVMGSNLGLNTLLADFSFGRVSNFTIEYIANSQSGKKVDLDIINTSGDLVQYIGVNLNSSATSVTNIRNINRIAWSDSSFNNNIPSTVELIVRQTAGSVFLSCIRTGSSGTAIITIPNGYIGVISNIGIFSDSTSDVISMVVKDRNNNVLFTRYMTGANTLDGRYNSMGSFNHPLYPGQSVFFASIFGTTVEKFLHGLVTLTAI